MTLRKGFPQTVPSDGIDDFEFVSPEELQSEWNRVVEADSDYFDDNTALEYTAIYQSKIWIKAIHSFHSIIHIDFQLFALNIINDYFKILYVMYPYLADKECECIPSYVDFINSHFTNLGPLVTSNYFIKHGEHWHIRFGNVTRTVNDYKGMKILETIFSHSNSGHNKPLSFIGIYERFYLSQAIDDINQDEMDEHCDNDSSEIKKIFRLDKQLGNAKEIELSMRKIAPNARSKKLQLHKINKEIKDLSLQIKDNDFSHRASLDNKINMLYYKKNMIECTLRDDSEYIKIKNIIYKNISDTKKYLKIVFPELYEHIALSFKSSIEYVNNDATPWITTERYDDFGEIISAIYSNIIKERA